MFSGERIVICVGVEIFISDLVDFLRVETRGAASFGLSEQPLVI